MTIIKTQANEEFEEGAFSDGGGEDESEDESEIDRAGDSVVGDKDVEVYGRDYSANAG